MKPKLEIAAAHAADSIVLVLAVGVPPDSATALRQIVDSRPLRLVVVGTLEEAREIFRSETVGVLVCEQYVADGSWTDVIKASSRQRPEPPFIVISQNAADPVWTELIRRGGFDLLEPPHDPAELERVVRLAVLEWQFTRCGRHNGLRSSAAPAVK